jgi:hypothetical protein
VFGAVIDINYKKKDIILNIMNRNQRQQSQSTILGSGFYDRAVNTLLPNAKHKLRDGEKHGILYTKDGFQPASYMGPGTDVIGKIKDGIKPITKSDKVAQAHDLRYSLASNRIDVRSADIKMVSKLNDLQKNKEDYRFNILMGKIPIQAKMKLENWGIVKEDTFASRGGIKEEDIPIAKAKLKELEIEGYGKKKKNTWLLHVTKCKQENPGIKYKDILKIASKTYIK